MTVSLYIQLALWTVAAVAAVQLLQIPVRKKCKTWIRVVLWIVKAVALLGIAFEMIADASPLFWNWGYLFAGLYLALLGDVITGLLCFIPIIRDPKERRVRKQVIIAAALTLLVTVHALISMAVIRPHELTYTSEKLDTEHKIVFVSDLHYGSSQTPAAVEKALKEIEAIDPDMLLLGGDLVDEHTTKEEMEYIFRRIGEMGLPTYYIYGNHDRQERGDYVGGARYTPDELKSAIESNGIRILKDELETVSEDLVLLGREDPSHPDERKAPEDLPEYPEGTYVIALEHTPYQTEDIQKQKADLQLSGHTHAGQLFPLRILYTVAGLRVVGEYQEGNTTVYVSPGITGWFYPLRNESHCWYEVITLKPA